MHSTLLFFSSSIVACVRLISDLSCFHKNASTNAVVTISHQPLTLLLTVGNHLFCGSIFINIISDVNDAVLLLICSLKWHAPVAPAHPSLALVHSRQAAQSGPSIYRHSPPDCAPHPLVVPLHPSSNPLGI